MQTISIPQPTDSRDAEKFSTELAGVVDKKGSCMLVTAAGERAILVPISDYSGWEETEYLLRSPTNARHLQRSLGELEQGQANMRILDEA